MVLGISDPERTRFESYDFEVDTQASPQNLGGELVLEPAAGRLRLSATDDVPEDDGVILSKPSPLPVRILHTVERTEDAGYIQAALSAIMSVGGPPLDVEIELIEAGRAVEEPTTDGLTFWLAAAPVPEARLASRRGGGVLISDGLDRWRSCHGPAVLPATFAAAGAWLSRCSPADPAEDAFALWTDGMGVPLLTLEALERGRWFRFHGRFHPDWSDLVFGAALPRWLDSLVRDLSAAQTVSSATAASDQRRSSPGERVVTAARTTRADDPISRRSLAWLLWALAAVTLGFERWLSGRREVAVGDRR